MLFSERLKKLREERGYSMRDLAIKCNISKSTINMYEKGLRNPKYENLESLADLFNVDIDYLMCKTDVENAYKNNLRESDLSDQDRAILEVFRMIPEEHRNVLLEMVRAYANNLKRD